MPPETPRPYTFRTTNAWIVPISLVVPLLKSPFLSPLNAWTFLSSRYTTSVITVRLGQI